MDQQRARVGVASLGDAAQVVLAAVRALPRHEADPGPELGTVLELFDVTHRLLQRDGGGRDGPDARQRGDRLDRCVALAVSCNALVEFTPLPLSSLQRQAGQRAEFIGCVFEHLAEHGLQLTKTLREQEPVLGEQAADAVDAGRAVLPDPLTQPVHAQHALLIDGLHRDEAHRRARGGLADRRRVVGVVLAAGTQRCGTARSAAQS